MSCMFRNGANVNSEDRLVALPLTKTHGVPGEFFLKYWPDIGVRPTCTLHGAMLRVSPDRYWYRCATCNIGCEDTGRC